MEEIINCDQCFNFCPIEAVKCHRGEVLRDRLQKEQGKGIKLNFESLHREVL